METQKDDCLSHLFRVAGKIGLDFLCWTEKAYEINQVLPYSDSGCSSVLRMSALSSLLLLVF